MKPKAHAMTMRLNAEDLETLDEFATSRGGVSRAVAIRMLIRESTQATMVGIITEALADECRKEVRAGIRRAFKR